MPISKPLVYTLTGAILIGAGRFALKLKKLSETVSTRFKSLSFNKTRSLQFTSITFNIEVINPTGERMHIKNISGDMILERRRIANFRTKTSFVLQPGLNPVSFSANISNPEIFGSVLKMAFTRTIEPIQVNYIMETAIPFLKLPQSFTFSAKSLI